MAFVLLFIYITYMAQTGHSIPIPHQCLVVIMGMGTCISWWVKNFATLTSSVGDDDDNKKVKRLDDWK